eukprot:SAG31_NODE_11075_length_1069_cov_0.990722_3_plen_118_part_01
MALAFEAMPPEEQARAIRAKFKVSYSSVPVHRNLTHIHGEEGGRQLIARRRPDIGQPLVRRVPTVHGDLSCLFFGARVCPPPPFQCSESQNPVPLYLDPSPHAQGARPVAHWSRGEIS